jgi:hypothetical protein
MKLQFKYFSTLITSGCPGILSVSFSKTSQALSMYDGNRFLLVDYKEFPLQEIVTYVLDRLRGLVVSVLGYMSGGPGSIPGTPRKRSSGSGTGSTQAREYN